MTDTAGPASEVLAVGDVLYRVAQGDPPDPAWGVETRRVTRVLPDGRFSLDRTDGFIVLRRAVDLGTRYHRTPIAAAEAFLREQRLKIEPTQRAIRWAESQIRSARGLGVQLGTAQKAPGRRDATEPGYIRRGNAVAMIVGADEDVEVGGAATALGRADLPDLLAALTALAQQG